MLFMTMISKALRMLLSQSFSDDDIAHLDCFNVVRRKSRQLRRQLKDSGSCQNLYD